MFMQLVAIKLFLSKKIYISPQTKAVAIVRKVRAVESSIFLIDESSEWNLGCACIYSANLMYW